MNIEKERLEKILSKLFKFIQQNNNELINEFIKSAEITGEEVNEIQLYINNEDDGFLSDGYIRSLVTEEMYNIPLENLDLGLRAYQCISRANVKRLRDLKCIYCFCKIRNLGRKCLFELISKLEALRDKLGIKDFGIAEVLDGDDSYDINLRKNIIRFEDFINNDLFDPSNIDQEKLDKFERIIRSLSEREEYILRKRYGIGTDPMTLKELGVELNCSAERIRQIELNAKRHFRSNQLRQNF